MLPFAPVSCCLTLRSSASAPSARSTAPRSAPASMPSASDALHQHARPREPVAQLERERAARRGRAPRPACRRCTRAAARASPAPPPRSAPPAPRSRPSARPSPCRAPPARAGLRQAAVLGLDHDAPAGGPVAGVERDDDVAHLAGGLAHVADRLGVVALGERRCASTRLEDRLLEAAPLGRAALALGLDLLELVLLVAQRLQLLLQLAELLQQRPLGGVASGWRPR